MNAAKKLMQAASRQRQRLARTRSARPPWTAGDDRLISVFLDESADDARRYDEIFTYFISGFCYYSLSSGARAYYPGVPSDHGADIDAIEGFSRVAPLAAAWVASGRNPAINSFDGRRLDLVELVSRGLLAGTDPQSDSYWGDIEDYDQKLLEAADLALTTWLLRDSLWAELTARERDRITSWLSQVNGKRIVDNNWHLAPVLVNQVLHALGRDANLSAAESHYRRIRSFYRGGGWFSDGAETKFDLYNAWAVHYSLFWLNEIAAGFDGDFPDQALDDFVSTYRYFFSTDGFPVTGRSVCYRMATPAPLIAAVIRGLPTVSPGEARRALDAIWRYFVEHGAVKEGRVTQGYWNDDEGLLESYIGPASCLWSLRSLVLAFYCGPRSAFWSKPARPLAVEQGDYEVSIPAINWELHGNRSTREVLIVKPGNRMLTHDLAPPPQLCRRLAAALLAKPLRRQLEDIGYCMPSYSSHKPFWLVEPEERKDE